MTTFRTDVDWTTAYVRCPICGRKQYGKRATNWRPRDRVCAKCFKDYTSEDIDSMLSWLSRICRVRRDRGLIFVVEWKRRHGDRPITKRIEK